MIFLCPLNFARSKFAVVIFRGSLSSRIFLKSRKSRIYEPAKIKENKVEYMCLHFKEDLERFSIAIVANQNTRTKSKVTCQISKKKMHEADGAKGGKMHAISCECKVRAV